MPEDIRPQRNTPTLRGFQKPNEILTPNQFFDVCLPHHSTQVIRVVGFLIRESLGYTNDDGQPFCERFRFSQQQIALGAGVAPSAVKRALTEAVDARFLNCVRPAVSSAPGRAAAPAEYELRWNEYPDGVYVADPRKFKGFFAAEGNRTSIPDEFFSHVLPHNTKSVIRFVGAVIRNTLGIKASHGRGRVKRAQLSYGYLQRYLNLTSHALAEAIRKAMARSYVVRLVEGVFDPRNPENQRQAIYTVKWCQSPTPIPRLSTGEVEHTKNSSETTPKTPAGLHTKNSRPLKGFLNRNHLKQQDVAEDERSPDLLESFRLLREMGYPERDARQLAGQYPLIEIRQQIDWLDDRQPDNPRGMLRRALEGQWEAPARSITDPWAMAFARGFYAGRWDHPEAASQPSQRDLRAAREVISKLTQIHGHTHPEAAMRWGRSFGRHYGRGFPKLIPSLAYATRVLIDDLLQAHRNQAKAEQFRAQRDRPEPQNPPSPDRQAWLSHLAKEEPGLRQRFPDAHAQFEERRAVQRQTIQRSGMPELVDRMLEIFDRPATRLVDLQRAFPEELPTFERWKMSKTKRSIST